MVARRPLNIKSPAFLLACLVLGSCLASAKPAWAEHPDAEKLLPEKTVLFVKLENLDEFIEGMSNTAFGKMLQDEKVAPVVESLYGSAKDAYSEVEGTLGVSLDELRNVVSGEVSFALVTEKDQPLAFAFFIDFSGSQETANRLLEVGEERAELEGGKVETEDVGDVTIRSVGGGGDESVHYFQKNESICGSNDVDLTKLILARWKLELGEELAPETAEALSERLEARTFDQNRKFLNVMKMCEGDRDLPPQGRFFIDPFELIRSTQTGPAGTAALGILRGLGIDGLLGVGASMTVNHEEFDEILHLHISLANPRSGIIKMLAIEPGDLTPEPIYPANLATYMSANWNVMTTYSEIEKLFDMFNGEGAMAEELDERFTERFGVNLKEDILASMDGRISLGQLVVDETSFNGNATLISAKLKDPAEFEDILADLRYEIEELADREIFTAEKYKGVEYYLLPGPPTREERERRIQQQLEEQGREDTRPRRNRVQMNFRRPQPCIGVVGDYLVFSDSVDMFREAINSERNPDDLLADDPSFKRMMREVTRQLDGRKPAMITYQRPEEIFRMFFEAVKDDQTKSAIKDQAEDNPFFQALEKAFVANELPDFEDLAKYFSPSIGVMTNDETGFHYMSFSKKPDLEE